MKKLLIIGVVLLSLISCQKPPITNYSIGNIIKPNDWESKETKTGGVCVYLRKKILVKDILTTHSNSKDSLELDIFIGDLKEFKKMPNPKVLENSINELLLDCKYACKNTATFKPYELNVYLVDKILPHEPTKTDYEEFDKMYGEYKNDKYMHEYYRESKKRMVERCKKGQLPYINLSLGFIASNAYGVPDELRGYGKIENGIYKVSSIF